MENGKGKNDLCKGKLMVECYLLVIFTRKDSRHRLMDSALIRWGNSCCTEKCIKISWDLIYLKQKKRKDGLYGCFKKKKRPGYDGSKPVE